MNNQIWFANWNHLRHSKYISNVRQDFYCLKCNNFFTNSFSSPLLIPFRHGDPACFLDVLIGFGILCGQRPNLDGAARQSNLDKLIPFGTNYVNISKTPLSQFSHDRFNPILLANILTSDVINACYASGPAQHLCLHYLEVSFIVFYSRTPFRTIEGDRADDAIVNFRFVTFVDT